MSAGALSVYILTKVDNHQLTVGVKPADMNTARRFNNKSFKLLCQCPITPRSIKEEWCLDFILKATSQQVSVRDHYYMRGFSPRLGASLQNLSLILLSVKCLFYKSKITMVLTLLAPLLLGLYDELP